MADLTGQRLGPYRLDAVVGRGGMATVYRARQEAFGRDVAVKVMDAGLSHNDAFVARFEREAQVSARLEHPHILPVIDFGRDGAHLYLVMRLIDGGALGARLENGMFSLAQIDRLVQQVAAALDYAHQRGVVHRDLKPDNVLLDDTGNAYLTDFGIAKMLASTTGHLSLTAEGNIMGTPAYMAPEQWRSEPVDARTDIYALGVILYQMLLGILPFKSDTPFGMMYQHVDAPPPPPCVLNPALPEGCERVVLRALAKQPDARYPAVRPMADDLHRALAALPRDQQDQPLVRAHPEALGGVTLPAPIAPVQVTAAAPPVPRADPISAPRYVSAPPPARPYNPPRSAPRSSGRWRWIVPALALPIVAGAIAAAILLLREDDPPVEPPVVVAEGETATPTRTSATTATPAALPVLDPSLSPASATPPVTADGSCSAAPPELYAGAGGRTTLLPAEDTRVRQTPGLDAALVRSIPPGQTFGVLDGPVCQDAIWWYEIHGISSAGEWDGWIGGGMNGVAWIEPFDVGDVDCPGAADPRLAPGQQGRVTLDPPLPSRMRSVPSTEGGETNVVTRLQPGKVFDVISGPVCGTTDPWRWWQIEYQGQQGWIAEGQPGDYWLEPVAS
jgi:serine/threonine protein kinase